MKLVITSLFLCISFASFAQKLSIKQTYWTKKYYIDDVKVKRIGFINTLKTSDEAYIHWKKARGLESFGTTITTLGAVSCLIAGSNIENLSKTERHIYLGTGTLMSFIGILGTGFAHKNINLAVEKYNKTLEIEKTGMTTPPSPTLGLGISENGIGIHFNF